MQRQRQRMNIGNHCTQEVEYMKNVQQIFGLICVKMSASEKEQPVIEITEFLW